MKTCGENISLNFGPRNLLTTQEKLPNLKSTTILLTLVDVVLINSTKTSEEIFNFKQSISLHLTLCLSVLHPFDIFAKECNVSVILGGNLIFFSCWLLAAYIYAYICIYICQAYYACIYICIWRDFVEDWRKVSGQRQRWEENSGLQITHQTFKHSKYLERNISVIGMMM